MDFESHNAEDIPALDLTGYRCPMPVIRMAAALRRVAPGEILVVRADDPIAAIDIPHFCREAGHEARRQPDEGPAERPVCVFLVTRAPNLAENRQPKGPQARPKRPLGRHFAFRNGKG